MVVILLTRCYIAALLFLNLFPFVCIHYTGNIGFVSLLRDQQWQFFFAEHFCETSYINYIPIMASRKTSKNYSTAL